MSLIDEFHLKDPVCKFRLNKREFILSTLAINLLSMALPIMVLQVYDRVMVNQSVGTLTVLAIGVCIAVILEGILRVARSFTTGWVGMMYEYSMAANAMRMHVNADPALLPEEGSGKRIQNLNSFSNIRNFYSGQSLVTMIDVPFATIFLFLISYLTGILVLVPLILIIFFTIVTWFIGNNLKQALTEDSDADDKKYNFIIEALQGIHTIKSLGVEGLFARRYECLEEEASIRNYKTAEISNRGYSFGIFFNEILIVSIVVFGAPMVVNGDFTSGALVATILLAGRLMQPIQKTLFLWTQFQEYRIAADQARKMFKIQQIERSFVNEDEISERGTVTIENLEFSYGNNDKKILNGINLKLKAPQVIAIQGESNSGRSSLMRLISGISCPTNGSIFVDGIEVSRYPSEQLIKHVGFISQETVIFQGSILDNITAFDESMNSAAMEIATLLNLDEEISLLPSGYNTKIGDSIADIVTPGVKQRIAIARVLVHKPKVILFHDADKGLDKEGYHLLLKLLNRIKGQVVMILISDDYNINDLADQRYFLREGKLFKSTAKDKEIYEVKPYRELKI